MPHSWIVICCWFHRVEWVINELCDWVKSYQSSNIFRTALELSIPSCVDYPWTLPLTERKRVINYLCLISFNGILNCILIPQSSQWTQRDCCHFLVFFSVFGAVSYDEFWNYGHWKLFTLFFWFYLHHIRTPKQKWDWINTSNVMKYCVRKETILAQTFTI